MNWDIDSGEEAEIQLQHNVNTLLLLSNNLVVSTYSDLQEHKHLIDVFDVENDYEQIKTIITTHEASIVCLAEHNKYLLTGSLDK